MAKIPSGGSGSATIADVFDQKGLWKWWEQNNGHGTNMFDGVSEKGIDYSTTFGTPVGVPVGGKILRIVGHTNSVGDIVELQAADGSVWLYQHITASVKVGQTLGVGGVVGTENGLPVDQYSTGPHIEVRYCLPGTWNPAIDSWYEPWVNPFPIFSQLSNTDATGPIDTGGFFNGITGTITLPINALAPNANVTAVLIAIDQLGQLRNPFDLTTDQSSQLGDSIPIITGITGAKFPDPIKWLGDVGNNLFLDARATIFRLGLILIGLVLFYQTLKKFIAVDSIVNAGFNIGKTVAML